MEHNTQASADLSAQTTAIITTEHVTLQSGRSITVADASGRASLFLGTVSSTLVAVAFIGQISQLGTAFFVFSLVLFPALFFLGVVTFERVLQSSIEDVIYGRAINRIRHLYVEHAPQLAPYFLLSARDDDTGFLANIGARTSWWQIFLTTAGMIAVINSIIGGACVGIMLFVLFRAPTLLCAVVGLVVFLVSVVIHQLYQLRQWRMLARTLPVRFPSVAKQQ